MNTSHRHSATLRTLRQQIRRWNPRQTPGSDGTIPLMALLPGVPRGGLVELLSPHAGGGGTSTVAFWLAGCLQQLRQPVVIIDPRQEFCPPGGVAGGLSLSRTAVIRASQNSDVLWVLEQSLRSTARAVVICQVERLTPAVYRRLKLAAERGGGTGFLLRPARFQSAPSWADVRMLVLPQPMSRSPVPIRSRRVRVEVLHVKGSGFDRQATVLDINDETGVVSVAAELAHSTAMAETA